jgi:hypothetical protein
MPHSGAGDSARWLWKRPVASLLGLLLLWLAAGVVTLVVRRDELAMSWEGPRLAVPVVVIESDDWGNGVLWADAREESGEDQKQASAVEHLSELLQRHQDSIGRHPVLTAFVVTGQADFSAILADPKRTYHRKPIDEAMPMLVAALRKAETARLFAIAYHAHDHRNPELWSAAMSRAFEDARCEGRAFGYTELAAYQRQAIDGLTGQGMAPWGGEYYDVREGSLVSISAQAAEAKVREGLNELLRAFGRRSVSTVAPRYLWGPAVEAAWCANGIQYVHGVDWQNGPATQTDENRSRKLGFHTAGGLVGVPRNVHLEVSPDKTLPSVDMAFSQAKRAWACGQPAVISTHSYNYYDDDPAMSEAVLRCLDQLLRQLEQQMPDLVYLSSEEIGQFGDRGRVTLPLPNTQQFEIVAANPLEHAWYWTRGLYQDRSKFRVWAWGVAALGLLSVCACIAGKVRGRARYRAARHPEIAGKHADTSGAATAGLETDHNSNRSASIGR